MGLNTRGNVYNLLPEGPEIAAIRRGVAAMQARSSDDPTSWIYQANIHGTDDPSPLPTWNQCQHGSFFFLCWHRMYLYWFERILQAASGDPNLVLPYWNYSNRAQRALPIAFRQPADASNPLYVAEPDRGPGINDGLQLSGSTVSFSRAFRFVEFFDTDGSGLSFGGQQVLEPVHFQGPHSALEGQPHDVVHVDLGGWMSDPNFAAQDPIFWLHHANIDRLWKRWLDQGGGRSNPTDNEWLTQSFAFFDENGQQVTMSGQNIVDTVAQLNYSYDDDPPNVPTPSPAREVSTTAAASNTMLATTQGMKMIELGALPVKVTIPMGSTAHNKAATIVANTVGQQRIALNLEGIHFDKPPAASHEIYINLPKNQKPDYQSIYYVGSLGVFGMKPHDHGHATHMQGQPKRSFDITDIVQALHACGEWHEQHVEVTFVMRGLMPAVGETTLPTNVIAAMHATPTVQIERVTITTR